MNKYTPRHASDDKTEDNVTGDTPAVTNSDNKTDVEEDPTLHDPSLLVEAKKLGVPNWVLEMIEGTDEYIVLIGTRQLIYANQIIGIAENRHNQVWLKFSLPRFREFPENPTHVVLNKMIPNREANFCLDEIAGAMPFTCRHDGWEHHDQCGDCGKFTDDIYAIANSPIPSTTKFNQVKENVPGMEFDMDERVEVLNPKGLPVYGDVEALDPATRTYKVKLTDDQGTYWYKGIELAHVPTPAEPERSTVHDGVEFKIGDKVTVQGVPRGGEIIELDLLKPKAHVRLFNSTIVEEFWYHLSKLTKVEDDATA